MTDDKCVHDFEHLRVFEDKDGKYGERFVFLDEFFCRRCLKKRRVVR